MKKILFFIILPLLVIFSSYYNNEKEIKEYGIVIFPEKRCIKKANSLNKEIEKRVENFPNPSNHWHITLFQGVYSKDALKKIIKKLKKLDIRPLHLTFTDIYSTENRWIDYGIENNQSLQRLHEDIAYLAAKYHKQPLARIQDIYEHFPKHKRKYIKKYGHTDVMEDYRPHMTLFYKYPIDPILAEIAKNIASLIDERMTCEAEKLAIGELEYNGNLVKIIYSKTISE